MARTITSQAPHRTQLNGVWLYSAGRWIAKYWQNGILIALFVFIILKKDVAINLQMEGGPQQELAALSNNLWPGTETLAGTEEPTSTFGGVFRWISSWFSSSVSSENGSAADDLLNLPPSGPDAIVSSNSIASNRERQINYIDRFARYAREEQMRYGIPVSITLAQGLLESNSGNSSLAKRNNNHFGIKCFSKSCAKGHCRNFSDDHHKDFFRIYSNPQESYRAHSVLLQGQRYRHLKKLDPRDYSGWANGLQRAGYATDPAYAKKLIYLIQTLDLDEYDS